jgi:hypothetical protein
MMCVTADALAAPVAALVQRCGPPAHVISRNDGNHFIFSDDGATVDALVDPDAAIVRALDIYAQSPATLDVAIDGVTRSFAFGSYDVVHADADLTGAADYSFGNGRAYRLDTTHELVLTFSPGTKKLTRVSIGERLTLERMKLLPEQVDRRPFAYVAPVAKHIAVPDGSGAQATIVRVDIDRFGIVRLVTVIVASDDPVFDSKLGARLDDDSYEPALLANRAVNASVFRELRH